VEKNATMSEENAPEENSGSDTEQDSEGKTRTDSIKGGIRQGIGMLNAMKDAIEETLNEAKERGDLSPERAKEVMRTTLEKAQAKAGEARDALDFVKQKEFDGLKGVVDGLKERVKSVERSLGLEAEEAPEEPAKEEGDA
jgi:polyhydroxyalkanoate synthesis regulator phasin